MDYADSIEPVTTLKTKSAEMIRKARESRQPIIITQNGKATAVLQDIESFQSQRQALLLLKYLSVGDQQLQEGQGIPHRAVKKRLEARLKKARV